MPPGVGPGSGRLPQGHDDSGDDTMVRHDLARVGQKRKKHNKREEYYDDNIWINLQWKEINNEQKGNNNRPYGPSWWPRFGEGDLEKETYMEKEKRCEIMKSQKIRIILYFYFC